MRVCINLDFVSWIFIVHLLFCKLYSCVNKYLAKYKQNKNKKVQNNAIRLKIYSFY